MSLLHHTTLHLTSRTVRAKQQLLTTGVTYQALAILPILQVQPRETESPSALEGHLQFTMAVNRRMGATYESFDSMGLTAVNTNDSSHSTRLTAVDSTSRNPPGAADGDVAPLSNADSIAALTTNWSSWSAAVDIFDDSKLWGKAEIVMEAAGGPTKLTSSVPVAQPRARPAPTSDIATQTENAPRPTLKLWFGEKARALELFCQRQARAYAAP
jgi:hypothetical protein